MGEGATENMTDGHTDTVWKSKSLASDPQTVTFHLCGTAVFTKMMLTSQNALREGISKATVEVQKSNGVWETVLEKADLSPMYPLSNGETGCMSVAIPKAEGEALRLTILDTGTADGTFNIAEVALLGSSFVSAQEYDVNIQAKRGELVTLPDGVEQDGKEIPVFWSPKTVLCKTAGVTEYYGRIGTKKSVTARVCVSEQEQTPGLCEHWAKDAVYALTERGVLDKESATLRMDDALRYANLAEWMYRALSIDRDYLPERMNWISSADDTEKTENKIKELAVLGIFPQDIQDAENQSVTRASLARIFCAALEYEKNSTELPRESLNFEDADACANCQSELEKLCAAGILANSGNFHAEANATNAEALSMLEALLTAICKVVTYPVPDSSQVSKMTDYTVKVNGKEVGIYGTYGFPGQGVKESEVNGRPVAEVGVGYFDFSGEAEVEVTLHHEELGDATAWQIRPLSEDIQPEIEGNVIRFHLYRPCNLSIEPWGTARPLQLFANPIDKRLPDFSLPNVYRYQAGVHYINPTELQDGDTVYLDGGAVVYVKPQEETTDGGSYYGYQYETIEPAFSASGKNVTVRGRGILSGRNAMKRLQRHQMLRIHGAENFCADGIIMLESSAWNVFVAARSDRVYLNNLKMVGYFANNDGIDFCDSKNGVIENCFANNADDSFIVKAWSDVENVWFRNCTAWNSVSSSFGAIAELHETVNHVSFTDSTVIHSTNPVWQEGSGGVIGIWDASAGDVRNMVFQNIVIEDAVRGKEILKINVNQDASDLSKKAVVESIVFRNIEILDTRDNRITLTTPFANGIRDVVFENVSINREKLLTIDSRFVLQNTNNIRVLFQE